MTRSVLVLGSTGSVGEKALAILAERPGEFRVLGLAARRSVERLAAQVERFRPRAVALADPEAARAFARLPAAGGIRVHEGPEGLLRLAAETDADLTVHAVSGAAGLATTHLLVERGKRLALANKESLVAAGHLLLPLALRTGAEILPVDSEHSAIFQCLRGERAAHVRRIYLTASGGPFLDRPLETFGAIRPEEALRHPNWSMGPRITVDSATMMNKALEVIEAHHLFGLPPERITVLIHPQSIVHSMVEFTDGSILAQVGVPDMTVPIHYALYHPDRGANGPAAFDPERFGTLTFRPPEAGRYPALALGYACARAGGGAGAVLNAADEVAVDRFLAGDLAFPEIVECAAAVLREAPPGLSPGIEGIYEVDRWAREAAARWTP